MPCGELIALDVYAGVLAGRGCACLILSELELTSRLLRLSPI